MLEIVDSRPNRFARSLLALVEPLAAIGACAIGSAQLYEENRRLSQFFQTIIASANMWLTVVDAKGNVLIWNQFAEIESGYARQAVVGNWLVWNWLLPEREYREQLIGTIEAEFRRGKMLEGLETPIRTREGKIKVISWHAVPLVDEARDLIGVVAFGSDVTNQTRLQSETLKAQKLEAVGTLAGGIAHDFNNLLTGVLGNIAMAKESTRHNTLVQELLDDAEHASLRARDLTQQLLTFARAGAPVKQPHNMARLLHHVIRSANRKSDVAVESIVPHTLWSAQIDERQINQAIRNIVARAVHVTPAGEEVHIIARNITVEGDELLPLTDGGYVEILIGDHGPAIPAERLSNIFDPYFPSTHDRDRLGLAVAYSIVHSHGGHLSIDSTPANGTTFHVYLPASPDDILEPLPDDAEFHSARILLMDDQQMVQQVAGRMLGHLQHEVDFADDGAEAIQKYRSAMEAGAPYDVVIMDLSVPEGMGGVEAMTELLRIDPEVKAIVSSGYYSDPVMANYAAHGFRSVLVKPYLIDDLRRTIAELLAGPAQSASAGGSICASRNA